MSDGNDLQSAYAILFSSLTILAGRNVAPSDAAISGTVAGRRIFADRGAIAEYKVNNAGCPFVAGESEK